jgi:hypothetical protein
LDLFRAAVAGRRRFSAELADLPEDAIASVCESRIAPPF